MALRRFKTLVYSASLLWALGFARLVRAAEAEEKDGREEKSEKEGAEEVIAAGTQVKADEPLKGDEGPEALKSDEPKAEAETKANDEASPTPDNNAGKDAAKPETIEPARRIPISPNDQAEAPALVAEPSARLAPPEAELALAKTELDNLSRRLATANQLAGRLGLGPQTASAERSWRNAVQFFAHREWDSTVRELNNYLNQTQVPQIKNYLKAQYMLGHCYEDMGYKGKALRAYFRYLATFLTAKEQDHAELVEVLRQMIPLASSDVGDNKELRELLASVTSLELPQEVQPLVYFYAAKAAANSAETALAQSWLEQTAAAPNDPILKAKALYMEALLALGRKDFERAKDLMSEVIQADTEGASRDLARLALARLAVHQKERDSALKYYALIGEASTSFKQATFESIYVHLDLKQDAAARSKALLYLARWPEGADALQLRMLMAYLDMRAGDLTAANASINAADTRLKGIHNWMATKLSDRAAIDHSTLTDFMTLTGGQLPMASSVKEAMKLFNRLAEVTRQLGDIRGNIRNVIYTIGRANVEQLRPFWVNRAEQLATLGEDLLKVGHRLSAAETGLYKDRLNAVAVQQLTASEVRRRRLLSPAAASHRQMQNWGSFAAFADLTRNLARAQDKLREADAQLAAGRFIAESADKKTNSPGPRAGQLKDLAARSAKLREGLAKGLELLRRARVQELAIASPHRSTAKFVAQYAASLHAEAEVLAKVRDQVPTSAQKFNAEDGSRAWAQWEFLMKELFKQLAELGVETKSGLSAMLAELDSEERTYDELMQHLQDLTGSLEGQLGLSMAAIIDQYSRAIDARYARNQKWQGDIHWLTFNSKLDEAKKIKDQTDLEQQILRDNLLDLQQGALWSWPK